MPFYIKLVCFWMTDFDLRGPKFIGLFGFVVALPLELSPDESEIPGMQEKYLKSLDFSIDKLM